MTNGHNHEPRYYVKVPVLYMTPVCQLDMVDLMRLRDAISYGYAPALIGLDDAAFATFVLVRPLMHTKDTPIEQAVRNPDMSYNGDVHESDGHELVEPGHRPAWRTG